MSTMRVPTRSESDTPFRMTGMFAPVTEEITATDLPVIGSIPRELNGRYIRNGPNPRADRGHWFYGDGMIHGVALRDGKASWYRNRWVRTPALEGHPISGPDGYPDIRSGGTANTQVISHAGKILCLQEIALPTEITRQLDTVGVHDFHAQLTTAMTPHPKRCLPTHR